MRRAALLLLLFSAGPALAYKPASPVRHEVFSPNGEFVLDVDPAAERLTAYATGDRQTALWSFNRHVWQEQHFLSDDGQTVGLVTWRFVQVDELVDGVCVEFWNRTGRFREYTFSELCPNPSEFWEMCPVGDFWRKWYTDVDSDGTTLRVWTTDEFKFVFALDDGRIVKKSRIGVPWWAWWLIPFLVLFAAVVMFMRRRRRATRRLPARFGT